MTDDENYPCLHCGSTESPTLDINEIRFFDNGLLVGLVDCYKTITGIKIEAASTNNKVCQMCQLQLKNAYTFKQKFKSQIIEQTTPPPPCLIPKVEIKVENEKAFEESVFVSEIFNKCLQSDKQRQPGVVFKVKSETIKKKSVNQCLECGKKFTRAFGLRYHQEKMHNPNCKKFNCTFCGKEFKHKSHLKEHFRIYHLTEIHDEHNMDEHKKTKHRTECKSRILDSKIEVKEENLDPGQSVNKSVTECLVCGKKFTRSFSLRYHIEKMHNPDLKKYICDICGKETKHKTHLIQHFKKKHSAEVKADPNDEKSILKMELQSRNIDTQHRTSLRREGTTNEHGGCVVCGKNIKSNYLLYRHQKTIHIVSSMGETKGKWKPVSTELKSRRFQCPHCGIVIAYRSRDHHLKLHLGETFKCDFCSRVFKSTNYLKIHITKNHSDKQTSTATREHRCDECGNIYHQKLSLEKHKLTHASVVESNKLECVHCGALFHHSRGLANHIKNAHVDICLKCPVPTCYAMLPNQKALNGHASLHNEISACECLVCEEGFSNFFELYQHYELKHRLTEKIYRKDSLVNCRCHCGLTFATINLIKYHIIYSHGLQTTHECYVCHKKFQKEENLHAHLSKHHNPGVKDEILSMFVDDKTRFIN